MFWEILTEITDGLSNSVRLDKILFIFYDDIKLFKLYYKLVKYNILFHIVPWLVEKILNSIFGLNSIYPVILVLNLFSNAFHIVFYIDLLHIIAKYNKQIIGNSDPLSMVSQSITMALYHSSMLAMISMVDYLIYPFYPFLVTYCKFFVLTVYHSFYCYNNLWQCRKISMLLRIDMHEKLWPYYFGYGILASIMYLYTSQPYFMALYNIYISFALSIPFLTKSRCPTKIMPYPSINLKIFSFLIRMLFSISRYLTNKF